MLEDDQELERVLPLFVRTGYTRFGGYLVGGMTAWCNAGFALEEIPQTTVHEVQTCSEGLQVLDVRTPKEWESGHIPCARHIFLPELPKKADVLDKSKPVITYCDSGYRASIAASLLQRHGFKDVRTMPGSWRAWQAANYPVEK